MTLYKQTQRKISFPCASDKISKVVLKSLCIYKSIFLEDRLINFNKKYGKKKIKNMNYKTNLMRRNYLCQRINSDKYQGC